MIDDDLDIDLSWGGTEEYEITYADGTTDLLDLDGREAAQLAATPDVRSVSRVTGMGANPRRLT